ncbi:MAG: hypothetical protein HYU67_06585 [Flavobacteriia bacterium]|nr:hypothetical protein [Flavobacteriia bacterium]
MNLKYELQNIISGKSKVKFGKLIQTITCYLKGSEGTSALVENGKQNKNQETEKLTHFIENNNLWVKDIDFNKFVSEGAEQRVYLKNSKTVLKLNDSIYYTSWIDYLHNLLVNNYFFPATAYDLKGFYYFNGSLYAVVEQVYVKANEATELENVKTFLTENGFNNTKNNDYYSPELGIILEDLHDENVLTKNGDLFFIDTVFYLTADFYTID